MGRIKDLLYTGVPGMGYTDDLLRENNILQRNVKRVTRTIAEISSKNKTSY